MFRAEIKYTKEDIRRFNRVHKKLRYRALYIVLDVIAVLGVLCVLTSLGLIIYWRAWSGEMTRLMMILVAMTGAWVFLNLSRNAAVLKGLNAKGTTTVTTTEEGIRAAAEGMSTDIAFSALCDIIHYRGTYFLYVDKRRATILPERCFVEGDPAAFGAFLAEKTGLEVKEIK